MKLPYIPLFCLLSCAMFYGNAYGQAARTSSTEVRAAQVVQLQAWGTAGVIESASPLNLDVRAADLAAARATEPLQNWVRSGGIIILHTDAAQAFGFQTVQARERTFNRAGQLWGRGENALPFGGSPLLLGGRSLGRKGQTDGIPGVRTVFYQLESGDALLRESGVAVVPLLRVEDNTLPEDGKAEPTFYAAAMRRYGRGWALFVPRTIEARTDGAQFQKNLETFVADASQGKWLTLPVTAIEAAYGPASQQRSVDWEQLSEALSPTGDPKKVLAVSEEAQLLLSFTDAKAVDAVLQQAEAAPRDEELQASGRALVYLLAARALWQLDSDDGVPSADAKLSALWDVSYQAREQLWQSQSGGPTADMTCWWNGIFALGAALPPVPTSYQVELIAFSYAAPALEATQWWGHVKSTDRVAQKAVTLAGAAAQQMAQQHQQDPPLLSYWKTDSGTHYYLQLAPIQAASEKYPPLPKEWGMPLREIAISELPISNWLVPLGSGKEMPVGIVPQPIIWPEANSLRPKMFWVFSQFWSGDIMQRQGFRQRESNVVMAAYLTNRTVSKSGITWEEAPAVFHAFLNEDAIYLRCAVHRPLPSLQAYLRQARVETIKSSEREYRSQYWVFENDASLQEGYSVPTPARVARLQAHLMLKIWLEDQSAPDWMDDGLGNIFSLGIARTIAQERINVRDISSLRAHAEMADRYKFTDFLADIARFSRVQTFVAEDPETELPDPPIAMQRVLNGTPLTDLDSTNQVSYFYKRFGAGAFVETLQRLGSGQSIDAALQATTGLTERQFFAAANTN